MDKQIQNLFGNDVQIVERRPVSGGCINDTAVLTLSNQTTVFLKKNNLSKPGMFKAEAMGLTQLICSDGPRVPKPIRAFEDASHQYLLMEYVHSSRRCVDYWETFGRQMAAMHQQLRRPSCGFDIDNYIGATPQQNDSHNRWIPFFAEMRLSPQMEMASHYLSSSLKKKLNSLIQRLDQYLIELEEFPSVIHGDLWTGNAMVGPNGEPVIIDPATYFGHREADIAMTMLFGQFGGHFYHGYNEYWPMEQGWEDRMDLYNLYHMLNHVNLFGGGYVSSVSSIVNRYT